MNNPFLNIKLNEPEQLMPYDDFDGADSTMTSEEKYWEKMFQILVELKNTHGHCLGPLNHAENIFL